MVESKTKSFFFRIQTTSFILLSFVIFSCSEEDWNNVCDNNTKAYWNTSLLVLSSGQKTHPCYPGLQFVSEPGINVNQNQITLSEAGGTATIGTNAQIQVFLGSEPKENVNIQVVVTQPSYAFVSPTNIVFTKNNWNQNQSIVVTANNDSVINGTHQTIIRLIPSSTDTSFRLNEKLIQTDILDNDKIIFSSGIGTQGALGGISGADAVCQAHANCPSGTQCKAMLVDNSFNLRRASVTPNVGDGQIDWVLKPFASYYRSNRTELIATSTSASLFTFNLTFAVTGSSSTAWTGLNPNWTNQGSDCTGWTVTGVTGYAGDIGSSTSSALGFNSFNCTDSLLLYCVEQ